MTTNKPSWTRRAARLVVVGLAWQLALQFCPRAGAYPPGPYHVLYGTIRDQYGTPLSSSQTKVVLQTPSGLQIAAPIIPGIAMPGANYMLKVPLDSGVTPDLYQPDVLVLTAPFKLLVVIASSTNLPIEMATNFVMGQWAQSTRIDLTLGIDSNGDGIPDAWELAFLAALGTNVPLSSLTANTVLTPDGLTLKQQYLYGTYLFDPGQPLVITFVGFKGASPVLQFPTITGHTYTISVSPDLHNWAPAPFNLATDTVTTPTRSFYFAPGTATVTVDLVPPPLNVSAQFYRVLEQ